LLRVKMQGFENLELEVKVGANSTPPQNVRLELASAKEEITVSARPSSDPLSADQNATAVVLDHDLLKSLPTKKDDPLAIANLFHLLAPPRRREWLEGELDGPLVGGKATFFLGGDLLRDNDNEFVTAITPSGPVLDTAPVPRRTGHLLGRTDIRLTPLNLLSVRYNWSVDRWANQGVGGFDLTGRGWTSNKRTQELRVSDIFTPSSAFLNEFVFDFRRRPKLFFSLSDAPAILVNGAFNSGGAQVSRQDMEKDVEFQNVVSYFHGKHSRRFGGVVKSRFI